VHHFNSYDCDISFAADEINTDMSGAKLWRNFSPSFYNCTFHVATLLTAKRGANLCKYL